MSNAANSDGADAIKAVPQVASEPADKPTDSESAAPFAYEVGAVLAHRYALAYAPENSQPAHLFVASRYREHDENMYSCRAFVQGRDGVVKAGALSDFVESELVGLAEYESARPQSARVRTSGMMRDALVGVMNEASAMLDALDRRAG